MTMLDTSESRGHLRKGFASASALPLARTLAALHARDALAAGGAGALVGSPYGAIAPMNDISTGLPLLQLPAGFAYKSYGWRGDIMNDGKNCPGGHDGMGVVQSRKVGRATELVLVRNHEVGGTGPGNFIHAPGVYDSGTTNAATVNQFGGGTTNLIFRDGNWAGMMPSLGGTQGNCAGGITPWGTWLSCEEVGSDAVGTAGKQHGYVFEVAPDPPLTDGQPIVGMGRFAHEAAAVDAATGIVYMTEDSAGKSGFYRYLPHIRPGARGTLAMGGVLQMARVQGVSNANLAKAARDVRLRLEWVDIADPDRVRGDATGINGETVSNAAGPFVQGWAQGALRMNRGKGIWYADGKMVVIDTAGGALARGTIWELELATQTMRCIYASPGPLVASMGDNLTVSPRNAILICEDGASAAIDSFGFGQRLMGLTAQGDAYIFAKNHVLLNQVQLAVAGKQTYLAGDHRANAFAGACFDPTGRYLFVNIQTPGITFAITGPWAKGPL
jgi:secreted PhoX family phosphatase